MYNVYSKKLEISLDVQKNLQCTNLERTVLQQSDKFQVDWFDRPGNTAIYDFFFLVGKLKKFAEENRY